MTHHHHHHLPHHQHHAAHPMQVHQHPAIAIANQPPPPPQRHAHMTYNHHHHLPYHHVPYHWHHVATYMHQHPATTIPQEPPQQLHHCGHTAQPPRWAPANGSHTPQCTNNPSPPTPLCHATPRRITHRAPRTSRASNHHTTQHWHTSTAAWGGALVVAARGGGGGVFGAWSFGVAPLGVRLLLPMGAGGCRQGWCTVPCGGSNVHPPLRGGGEHGVGWWWFVGGHWWGLARCLLWWLH